MTGKQDEITWIERKQAINRNESNQNEFSWNEKWMNEWHDETKKEMEGNEWMNERNEMKWNEMKEWNE